MSLAVTQLTKYYGQQKAVDSISFAINKGEIVGFLGPNGAGKSTTMKMITGYLNADGGTALVSGIDVAKEPLAAKQKIGYLPEANPLYYDLYVLEYLKFIAGIYNIPDKKHKIKEVIALTGLEVEQKKKLGQLSKGYKQRVGLAAALVHDPEVLILDEPTSGLDPNQIVEIRNVIKQQGENKTVLFSSHILQEVQAICNRVIIINKGKLVADNTIQNLQKHKSKSISVTFKEPLEPQWLQRLPAITQVNKVNSFTWQLACENVAEARREIMQLALTNNLSIVTLQDEEQNLEEVFRSLTK